MEAPNSPPEGEKSRRREAIFKFVLFYFMYDSLDSLPRHEKLRKFHINYVIKCGLRLFLTLREAQVDGKKAMISSIACLLPSPIRTNRTQRAEESFITSRINCLNEKSMIFRAARGAEKMVKTTERKRTFSCSFSLV